MDQGRTRAGQRRRIMRTPITAHHFDSEEGNPAGGSTFGNGFAIAWQNGPLGRHSAHCDLSDPLGCASDCTRKTQNGAFVEDIIAAAVDRLEYYQASDFASSYNEEALNHLHSALMALEARTADREHRAVEGPHSI